MKKAVHFDAGKIVRGFIADLLHDSGYEITFADVVQETVAQLQQDHSYVLFRIDHDYDEKIIDHVSAYSSITEAEEIIATIDAADVLTTSVMASNLTKVAPLVAKGLKKRLSNKRPHMIVMACEKPIMGTDILKRAMVACGEITEEEFDQAAVYRNTAVDRMVFDGVHHGKEGVEIGDAYELVIERQKLDDPDSTPIKGAEYVDDLAMYLQRKIYIINCGRAVSAYLGQRHGLATVQDVLRTPDLLDEVKEAVLESAAALEKRYGFTHASLVDYIERMMVQRFTTPGVSDSVLRVGRSRIFESILREYQKA
ncbi:mannitol dehydrogenase [uncultured Selenomonas sp.]|uniref:mannitol dehydrogenase family protein n=1 Tax=uncultured Selenomonas sp. TaxID=159275 RepID=UPI0028EAEBC9|nr:mannitol dehydrogenase [uncultured Selenomonas sp.]